MAEAISLAQSANTVKFRSWSPHVPRDMAEGAREKPIEAHGAFFLPDGNPPADGWPGVVIAQGLGGPTAQREIAYGRWLANHGYAALVLDSFGSRDITGPEVWKAFRLTTAMQLADAFGALAWMRRHPGIDGSRVALKGYSYGGMVTLVAAFDAIRALYLPDEEEVGFAAHIAYYPCSIVKMKEPSTTGAPMLVMIGKRDRNVSVERMKEIAEGLRKGGSDVQLEIFDCHHQWDGDDVEPRRFGAHLRHCRIEADPDGVLRDERSGWKIDGPFGRLLFLLRHVSLAGYTIQQDKEATRRSNAEVLGFLEGMRKTGSGHAPLRTAGSDP